MKGISPKKWVRQSFGAIFLVAPCLLLLQSCSWISARRTLEGEENKPNEEKSQTVSKEQYDQLLKKYEELVRSGKMGSAPSDNTGSEKQINTGDTIDIINDLSQIKPESELAETVDVFAKKGEGNIDQFPMMSTVAASPSEIEAQIGKIRKAEYLLDQNQFEASLKIIKEIEGTSNLQIKVRAKYLLGEMLFRQGEFDLSMQVFEEIITKYAFSGVVIKTLGRLIVCSERLKLAKKREQYFSILHDFFESA